MKIACLLDRLNRMPMVKLLAPFAAGIALAGVYELPLWFLAGAFVCTGIVGPPLPFGERPPWRCSSRRDSPRHNSGLPKFRSPGRCTPSTKSSWRDFPSNGSAISVADAAVTAWRDPTNGHWHASETRIRLYADSLTRLRDGERIRCRGRVRPFQGGAESLPAADGTAGLCRNAVDRRTGDPRPGGAPGCLPAPPGCRTSRPSADGSRSPGRRRGDGCGRTARNPRRTPHSLLPGAVFSHLLAVSGLHTGIVFVVVNALLWWLPLLRRGHLWKNLLAAGGHLALCRRGRIPAQRHTGRRDVHPSSRPHSPPRRSMSG